MKAHIGLCESAKPDKPIQQSGAQYLALVTLLLWLLPKNIVSWNTNKELSVLVHLFVFFFICCIDRRIPQDSIGNRWNSSAVSATVQTHRQSSPEPPQHRTNTLLVVSPRGSEKKT